MRKLYQYTFLILIMATLTSGGSTLAASRGISIISTEGQSLDLYRDYQAVVVGISNYDWWPKLPYAADDAKEVAAKLQTLNFQVKLVLDPTFEEMKKVLAQMVYDAGSEENRALLFYYAGHGETETLADKTKLGYIIPRDCPLLKKDPMGFAGHAISMKDIESVSLRIRSRHVLMLFDSCFSGSLFALVRAVPDDITEKSTLPVRQYITAGREDEQVPDRSMFKRCLLIGLEGDADLTGDGYITGSELGMYLSEKVVNYTRRRQHPQYGKINNPDLDRGDFIFVPRTVKPEAVTASLDRRSGTLAAEGQTLRKEHEGVWVEKQIPQSEHQKVEEERQKLAYVPETVKRPYDELKYGRGPFLIDDFEDKDLWSTNWNSRWNWKTKGPAALTVLTDPTQGANGTSSSMKIVYNLGRKSAVFITLGNYPGPRAKEVERGGDSTYDLSRFKKIVFYLKGRKKQTSGPKPNQLLVSVAFYGEDLESRYGKFAHHVNKTLVIPSRNWKRIEIPYDDLVPSTWTKQNVLNYPSRPDLQNVLNILFKFSSFKGDDGFRGSNTVWIDEITLE